MAERSWLAVLADACKAQRETYMQEVDAAGLNPAGETYAGSTPAPGTNYPSPAWQAIYDAGECKHGFRLVEGLECAPLPWKVAMVATPSPTPFPETEAFEQLLRDVIAGEASIRDGLMRAYEAGRAERKT